MKFSLSFPPSPVTFRQSFWRLCHTVYHTAPFVALPFILIITLTSCGFQLKGYSNVPISSSFKQIHLDCPISKSWYLCQQLRKHFQQQHVEILDKAQFTLSISPIEEELRTLSLQTNAAAAEYGLSYQVEFELLKNASIQTPEPQTLIKHKVSANQSYRHVSTALLAKERERNEIQKQLSQQLADEIFRQVSVFELETDKPELQTAPPKDE